MQLKKIAGPIRLDSLASGAEASFRLKPQPGGRMVKNAHYSIKILFCNDVTNTRISLDLEHGPDGTVSALHSTPISTASSAAAFPNLIAGDAGAGVINEYLHIVLRIKHNTAAAPVAATVEVYEMRKPF